MIRQLSLIAVAALFFACGGVDDGELVADAGAAAPDAGSLVPEYELEIEADLTWAATALIGNDQKADPAGALKVDDVTPAVYAAAHSSGGSSSSAKVDLQRAGHSLVIAIDTSATSANGLSAQGNGVVDVQGVCARARGAKAFRVAWTCDGDLETSGSSGALIQVGSGTLKCSRSRIEDGVVDDQPWNPQSSEETVSATDGVACWSENGRVTVSSTGGTGNGAASVTASITLTVNPIY